MANMNPLWTQAQTVIPARHEQPVGPSAERRRGQPGHHRQLHPRARHPASPAPPAPSPSRAQDRGIMQENTSPLAPAPGAPEVVSSFYERKDGMNNARRGPLRFEEGISTDTDVPNDFVLGVRQGTMPAPGRPNHNANVYEKYPDETMRERAHLGSAAWVEAPRTWACSLPGPLPRPSRSSSRPRSTAAAIAGATPPRSPTRNYHGRSRAPGPCAVPPSRRPSEQVRAPCRRPRRGQQRARKPHVHVHKQPKPKHHK